MTPNESLSVRVLTVDANDVQAWKSHKGAGGIPGSLPEYPGYPDMTPLWKEAGITLVRSYDWISRLDTRNNPTSLFPDWDADPTDPSSYNFSATDRWVDAVHAVGADVLFNFASSIPQNKLPALDLATYGTVVEHIVRHYAQGWAEGPAKPIRVFEFGDQPDLGPLHFEGPAVEFHGMYGAFAQAVKRVDADLLAGGPSLAFPLNPESPYREGFLRYVKGQDLPLDFFSFLWFSDASRDPLDFRFVAAEMRTLLDEHGFGGTRLMLSYWNYLAVPSSDAPSDEKAAFQAATAIYLQDTVVDDAIFFRADSGKDPHYGFIDPAAIYTREGLPDERAVAFSFIGQAMSGQRLAVTGGDESGFACAAGIDGDRVRVLIANFVAPADALVRRESDEFRFRIPIGPNRLELDFRLPPQRAELASAGVESAQVRLTNLPWVGRSVSISQRSLRGELAATRIAQVSDLGTVDLDITVEPQSVVLIELAVQ